MTQLRHYDDLGTARFVTFSCHKRYPVFEQTWAVDMLIEELNALRFNTGVRLLGYVIMPEHVHLVVWPPAGSQLGILIGQVKGRVGHRVMVAWNDVPERLVAAKCEGRKCQIFERRCYDHNCRTVEIVKEKILYCHKNPVTRGLVTSPEDWEWSSYRWYQGERDVPLAMDEVEL